MRTFSDLIRAKGTLLLAATVVAGCRFAQEVPKPERQPTELEGKITIIEGLRTIIATSPYDERRAMAEAELQFWSREFDAETGKLTEPVVLYPGPTATTEDKVLRAYWVYLRSAEAYEDLMLSEAAFGLSPEARKGIARRRAECDRVVRDLATGSRALAVPSGVFNWQREILAKRTLSLQKGPADWQRPLLEEMVRWWEGYGKALANPLIWVEPKEKL